MRYRKFTDVVRAIVICSVWALFMLQSACAVRGGQEVHVGQVDQKVREEARHPGFLRSEPYQAIPSDHGAYQEPTPTPPCYFDFDASHQGSFASQLFQVKVHRYYDVVLAFLHAFGGEDSQKLAELMNANVRVFTRETADSDNPVEVTKDYLAKHVGGTLTEMYKAETRALASGEFVRRPTEFRGQIPIWLEVSQVDEAGQSTPILSKTVQTIGMDGGGQYGFKREIATIALRPGLYRLQARSLQDSPLFFDRPSKIGVTYHYNFPPLKD
ncbi:MAG: DUF5625 family protein [Magnetococcus sp. MYC-9]